MRGSDERLVTGPEDIGGFLFVAGIEDAAELVVAREERIGFVDEKRGADLFDNAE